MTEIHKIIIAQLPPPKRLPTVLSTWESIPIGDAIQITVDHDPSHLEQVFQDQYPNTFQWEFLQQGPDLWILQLTKVSDATN